MYVCVCVCLCMCVCMWYVVCVCVCINININTAIHKSLIKFFKQNVDFSHISKKWK